MAEAFVPKDAPREILKQENLFILAEYKKQSSDKTYNRLLLQNEEGKVFDYRLVSMKLENRGIDPARADWKQELKKESNWMDKEIWKSSFGMGFEFSFGSSGIENKDIRVQSGVVISKTEVPLITAQKEKSSTDRTQLFLDGVSSAPVHKNVVGFLENETYLRSLLGRLKRYAPYAEKYAQKYNMDPLLVLAVICAESGGDQTATSKNLSDTKSSRGLMQISDGTWPELRAELKLGDDMYNINDNIYAGTHYLHNLLVKYENSIPKALLAYNRGMGNTDKFLDSSKNVNERALNKIVNYPSKVLSFYQLLEHLGGLEMLKMEKGIDIALAGFDSKAYIKEHSIKS